MRRRDILRTGTAVIAGTIGLAGCLGGEDNGGNGSPGTGDGGGSGGGGGNQFPNRNINYVIPFGEGGGAHGAVSTLQPMFEEEVGANISFQFQGGANTQIGSEALANANSDGYTIGLLAYPHGLFTTLVQDAEYKFDEDFDYLGFQTEDPVTVRIRSDDDRFDDMQSLVNYAAENPGELTAASSSTYGPHSVALLVIEEVTDAKFNFVPFGSGSDARSSVVTGETDITITNAFASLGIAEDTKTVAVFETENRWPDATNEAPTVYDVLDVSESEVPPDTFYGNFMWATPSGIEDSRLSHLQDSLKTAMDSDEYRQALIDQYGSEGYWNYRSPEETEQIMLNGLEFYRQWVSDLESRIE